MSPPTERAKTYTKPFWLMCLSSLLFFGSFNMIVPELPAYLTSPGTTSPTLLAWAADLSHAKFKGRGIASLYIFMEFGIGIGAFASGFIYGNQSSNFFITFTVCSTLAALAFIHLTFFRFPV